MSQFAAELTFDHSEYWSHRYAQDAQPFEWYRDYRSLAPVLRRAVAKADRVLHAGVGTSTLHESMADDGYEHIENVDYSAEAIDLVRERWRRRAEHHGRHMGFRVLDMRDMAGAFADSVFDVVLDKGTLDAMLCADDDEGAAGGMLREVRRVLRPGGRYVWCTSAAPRSRLAYFEHLGDHDLEVYTLDDNEDAAVAASSDAAALAQMRCASGRHYVYVLTVRKQRVA